MNWFRSFVPAIFLWLTFTSLTCPLRSADTIKSLMHAGLVRSEGGWNYDRFLQASRRSADALLQRAPDRYGQTHTPLWLSVISPTGASLIKTKPPNWQTYWDAEDYVMTAQGCNLYRDLPMLAALYDLTAVTGDPQYRNGVDTYLSFYLLNLPSPTTGLFPWGEHMSYNTVRDKLVATRHEMEHNVPEWELLWNVNPAAVQKEIEAIYTINIYDKERFLYDRHANYYSGEFDPLPVRGTYIKHSGLFAYSFLFLYSKTHDDQHLQWARKMANLYWQHRDPATEIVPGYVSHHGAGDVSTVQLWLAYYLMRAVELYPDPVIKETALKMVDSYLKYGYKPNGVFATQLVPATGQATWQDSTQLTFPDFPEYFRVQACWQAFRLSRQPHYLDITKTVLNRIAGAVIPRNLTPQAAGTLIGLYADVYLETGDQLFLRYSRTLADWTLTHLVDHDMILESANGYVYHNYNRPGELLRAWIKLYQADRQANLHWTTSDPILVQDNTLQVSATAGNGSGPLQLVVRFRDGKRTSAVSAADHGRYIFNLTLPKAVAQGPARLIFSEKKSGRELAEGHVMVCKVGQPPQVTWNIPDWINGSAPFAGELQLSNPAGVLSVTCKYQTDTGVSDSVVCSPAGDAKDRFIFTIPALGTVGAASVSLQAAVRYNPDYPLTWRSSAKQVSVAAGKTVALSLEKARPCTVHTDLAGLQLIVESPVTLSHAAIAVEYLPTLLPGNGKAPDQELLPAVTRVQVDDVMKNNGVRVKLLWPYHSKDAEPFLPSTLTARRQQGTQWLAVPGACVDVQSATVTVACDNGGTLALAGQRRLWWRRYFNGALLSSPAAVRMDKHGTLAIILDTRDADGILYALDKNGNTLWTYDAGAMQPFATVVDLDQDEIDEILVGGPKLVLFKADGTELWSAPFTRSNSPVAGDINGDGLPEIVATTSDGIVAAFTATGKELWRITLNQALKIPCLADVDGNRKWDIVVGGDSSLFCIAGNGQVLYKCATPGQSLYAPAVGDLNGDGKEEIVNLSRTDEQGFLNAYGGKGELLWSAIVSREPDWCPIITDFDCTGQPRILAQAVDPRQLALYDAQGRLVRTLATTGRVLQTAVPVDLDEDQKPDLLLHSDLSYRMWAIANDGQPLWSYTPASLTLPGAKIKGGGSLLVADIDHDGFLDVIGGDDETWLNAVKTETPCAPGQIVNGQFHGDCRHSGNYMKVIKK